MMVGAPMSVYPAPVAAGSRHVAAPGSSSAGNVRQGGPVTGSSCFATSALAPVAENVWGSAAVKRTSPWRSRVPAVADERPQRGLPLHAWV